MKTKRTPLTQKQVAVILKKIKAGAKSAMTIISHEIAALRGIQKEKAVVDVNEVNKLEEKMDRILVAMKEIDEC